MNTKEEIINEYLVGGISFRALGKKHGISRSTINRWVLEHQGFICMRKSPKESIILLEMNKEPREILSTEIIEFFHCWCSSYEAPQLVLRLAWKRWPHQRLKLRMFCYDWLHIQ